MQPQSHRLLRWRKWFWWCLLYGPATTRRIFEGRQMKRAINAHITTLQVLFDLYVEAFFAEKDYLKNCTKMASLEIASACNDLPEIKEAHQAMLHSLETKQPKVQLQEYNKRHEDIIRLCLNRHVCAWDIVTVHSRHTVCFVALAFCIPVNSFSAKTAWNMPSIYQRTLEKCTTWRKLIQNWGSFSAKGNFVFVCANGTKTFQTQGT